VLKKVLLSLALIIVPITFFFPSPTIAAKDLIKPTSRFYFLQTLGEEIKLLFTFSKELKVEYLLQLTDKKVNEISSYPTSPALESYKNNVNKLSQLAGQVENKEGATGRIEEANLRQQQVLARVYTQVPDQAKDAILKAQEESSKHVAQTIQNVQGPENAQKFTDQVNQIVKMEMAGRIEQIPMEGSPNTNPGEFTPKGLNEGNVIKGTLPLNPSEGNGENQMQPAQPNQMNQPVGQN
jgi:hypothetical protein